VPRPPGSIVRLCFPDSTRPVEWLRHSSTSRIVGGSSNTHKHTMAREIEGVVHPRSCTRVLMYPRALHPSSIVRLPVCPARGAHRSPQNHVWPRPQVCPPPHPRANSRQSSAVAGSTHLKRLANERMVESVQKRSAGRRSRHSTPEVRGVLPYLLSSHSFVPLFSALDIVNVGMRPTTPRYVSSIRSVLRS
jgi:hypothetical protein